MRAILVLISSACILSAQLPYSTSIEPSPNAHQIASNRGSAALWQSLKKLRTRSSLIMITAHPDDEDGGMLAYESRGMGARVALLTLNRGEGGANLMSPHFFDALGLVRTAELLAAGKYYGVDQYFTRLIDYGFSKTMAESIGKWTHDRLLYDTVRIVRTVRPLVITSVFAGAASDGHGNHQAAGAIAQEVFQAAGDPKIFPDQFAKGLRPWTPLKVYARAGSHLSVNLQIPEGTYDPVIGSSYLQIAREGLGNQKSQNGGASIPAAGQVLSAYHRFQSNVQAGEKEDTFFDGIDTSVLGIASLADSGDTGFLKAGLAEVSAAVDEAISKFSAQQPEISAPALVKGLAATTKLLETLNTSSLSDGAKYNIRHELQIKRVQFNDALAEALGLSIAADVEPPSFRLAIPGQQFTVRVQAVNQSSTQITLHLLSVEADRAPTRWTISATTPVKAAVLTDATPVTAHFSVTVPADAKYTRPYFTRPDLEQPYYDLSSDAFQNHPLAPYPLAAWADFEYLGVPVRIGQIVQTTKRVTGAGAVSEPLAVAPAIAVSIAPHAGIVPLTSKSFTATAVVHSNVKGPAIGTVRLDLPTGWKSQPSAAEFAFTGDGQDKSLIFQITPVNLAENSYQIHAIAEYNGDSYREGYQTVGYTGLRPYFLYAPATSKVSGVNVKIASGLRIGYVMGTGDDVPSSLENLSVNSTLLGPGDIATGDLSKYDALILGVRTYAARDDLRTYNSRILEYVRNGGVVIVQYNTPEFDHNFGPYPYSMTSNPEEVTDEASKVNILEPTNPIFNWPNKITEKDFANWIEERGSKWMKTWDPHYQALIETHDEGQQPQKGGLLYARYGKGIYIYNALAFYRQLPEGVPGAYRIFANMISLPKNPQR